MTDALARLRAVKDKTDGIEVERKNYAAWVADRVENGGWTPEDVAEYRAEVARIKKSGTDDEKLAATEFWAHKAEVRRKNTSKHIALII